MTDSHVLSALNRRRTDIEKTIAAHEKYIKEARRDLSHINATIRLFGLNGEPSQFPAYIDLNRLFKRGEIVDICKAALAKEGPLDTRELAVRVVKAKGLDLEDKVLRTSIAFRIVQALRQQHKRGKIGDVGKRKGVRVWAFNTDSINSVN